MALELMYITNNPEVAVIAQKYGVDRIWIDLETLGKEERQPGLDTVKSHHLASDIKIIAPLLTSSKMMVRVNPWNANSIKEIEEVIQYGAQIIMLPMWKTVSEIRQFIDAVSGRAKVSLLLETPEAVECLDEVLTIDGIDEIHIGLNDLHLAKNMKFMFELLADGTVEAICNKIKATGIPYGFGGIARIGEGMLPAEKVITEHYRLGSSRAILSRSFCNAELIDNIDEIDRIFGTNMKMLRNFENTVLNYTKTDIENNRLDVVRTVTEIVRLKEQNDING